MFDLIFALKVLLQVCLIKYIINSRIKYIFKKRYRKRYFIVKAPGSLDNLHYCLIDSSRNLTHSDTEIGLDIDNAKIVQGI